MSSKGLGAGVSRTLGWLLPLLLLSSMAYSQATKALITGVVADSSGAALGGATIQLLPLTVTGTTDSIGEFTLPEVAAGHYTLKVSFVGFKTYSQEIDVTAGKTLNLSITLSVATQSQEILVTAERVHGEADAINETRAADNILQVLPAEVITSLPNANVADAIGRLPSVTLYRIEGEGVYIQVRGTEPRLTNVTVDGITLPAPEPTVRQVRLDVIPSELVADVEINKTLQANMDANGIGGSVNLRTKTAGDQPTLNLFTKGGYTPIMNGRAAAETGGTYGQRFGKSKKFGFLINGSYDYNGRGIDNIQPALDPLSTFMQPFYDNDTIRQYRYYRYRYGFAGSADYKQDDRNNYYAHFFYSDLKDWGDKWYYSPVSKAESCPSGDVCNNGANVVLPSPTATSSSPKFYTSSKRPNASVGSMNIGGNHVGNDWFLSWELSASRSYEVSSAGNPKADFSWIGPSVYCNYNPTSQADKYRPTFGTCDQANSVLETATDWAFKDITTSTGLVADLDLTAQASISKTYTWNGHFGTFEGGFKIANAHRSQDATETVYDGWSTSASTPVATMATLQSGFDNTNYYDGTYFGGNFGPVSDFNKVQAFTLANLKGDIDQYKTVSDTWPNIFHTIERIPAGYVMNTIDFGKLHLQTGLRFEDTQMMTSGYVLDWAPSTVASGTSTTQPGPCPNNSITGQKNCYALNVANNNPSYLDVLPSLQARYALGADQNLRFVYSRGVARPDPYQLVPYVTADDTANTAAIGNPALRPEHANNYDLLYEAYLNPLGMIQGGIFFKQLTTPQITFQIPLGVNVAALPAGAVPASLLAEIENAQAEAGSTASVTQYINGENSYLWGFELSCQQHLSYAPGVLRGLGVSANYSYTASQMKGLWLRTDQPTLIDQSPNTWNFSPTYDTKRFSMRLGMTYNGKSLFSYNWISPTLAPGAGADPSGLGPSGPSGDVWTLAHMQVDAQATYRFWKGMSFLVSGLNLNNEVFGYYTGSDQFVNQREYYKPTYTGGIRYNFGAEKADKVINF
jgi:TonB-dependent receptor